MPSLSPEKRRSIVRVLGPGGDYRGTAFFVSRTAAITCWHVIRGLSEREIRLVGVWDGAEQVLLATAPKIHPEAGNVDGADLAVLEVDRPNAVPSWLCLHPGWPVESDPLKVFGYSSTAAGLDPRDFTVSSYDSAGRVFSMPNLAARGMSGGPVVNEDGNVIGIAAFYVESRNLTYFIPVARVFSFLRDQACVGLPAAPPFPEAWYADRLHAGLSSKLGSLHLHIDGGANRATAERAARLLDSNLAHTEVATIDLAIEGPQRSLRPEIYGTHTPTVEGSEALRFFTTTSLHSGPADPDSIEMAQIEDAVRQVLGDLHVRTASLTSARQGGVVVEVERVVGAIRVDGTADWVDTPNLDIAFQGFLFERGASEGENGPEWNNIYELHFSLDLPRTSNEPPLGLEMLLEVCHRAGLEVGGWFVFRKPDRWAFRSNTFLDQIDPDSATALWRRVATELDRLPGIDLHDRSLRLLIEESLGVWRTRFRKINPRALSVPELAFWERTRPANSEMWIVTGNFLGDQDRFIENAMIANLRKGVRYVYFLRSFADLNRWVLFRNDMQHKMSKDLGKVMQAWVYEFRDPAFWAHTLDCFVSIPSSGRPDEGYKLVREGSSNRVVQGNEMDQDAIDRVRTLLRLTMEQDDIISTRRLTDEVEFEGALVWLDFGLFELFGKGDLSRDEVATFLDAFDGEASVHVSRCGGEVMRSNEVGYVVVLHVLPVGRKEAVLGQALSLLRELRDLCDNRRPASIITPTHRAVLGFGRMRRIIRSNGRAVDGPTIVDCRVIAANLEPGRCLALDDAERLIRNAGQNLGVHVELDDRGYITWPGREVGGLSTAAE
jgi:hypothetical protein